MDATYATKVTPGIARKRESVRNPDSGPFTRSGTCDPGASCPPTSSPLDAPVPLARVLRRQLLH
jgi:hypothetical protein